MKSFVMSVAAALLISGTQADSLYNPLKSSVQVLNQMNFSKQVTSNREKGISVVHFYKPEDGQSKDDQGKYEKFAIDHKQMLRVGAVNCEDFPAICNKESVESFPTYRVYPPVPVPTMDLDVAGGLDVDKLKKSCYRHIGNRVIELTENNYEAFRTDNPNKPKMLLFTDKKSTPVVYKALSTHFDQTLEFGIIRPAEESLIKKFKVKDFPVFYLLQNVDSKPLKYDGDSYLFSDLFEFINIYSETFVFGEAKENVESAAARPWNSAEIPYIAQQSGNDVCFQRDGTLCVIYIVPNKEASSQKVIDELKDVQDNFSRKISRGIQFAFSRLDASAEPGLAEVFKTEQLPAIVVMNPGKRKRYLVHEGDLNKDGVIATLDKILGGDARFTNIKGNKLPELVSQYLIE